MPRVTKQSPSKSTKRSKAGIAGRIVPVSEVGTGGKFLFYGHSKTGKTRLGCSFPKPLLLIGVAGFGTEKGTRSVSNVKGVDFVDLEESQELEEVAKLEYKSFVLDTAGGFQERVVAEYTGEKPQVRKDWRHVDKGDWGPINSRTQERLRWLLDAAEMRGRWVVIIAHERAFDTSEESEVLFPHVGASLTPGVAGWLDGVTDYIGQCYVREATEDKSVKIGGKSVVTKIATGKVEYCLRVGRHPVYKTGFRVPVGVALPDVIVNPNFSKIQKLIG